jgi:hypothetical protein
MVKMRSYYPFEYLKHKLWPKEKLRIKMSMWLPTTKSQESPWFTCVQKACHILFKIFQRRLQLFFQPHLKWRSSQEIMGVQSGESFNFGNYGIPNLESQEKYHLGVAPMANRKKHHKGKVVASPKSGSWWVLWVCVCLWFIYAPKVW